MEIVTTTTDYYDNVTTLYGVHQSQDIAIRNGSSCVVNLTERAQFKASLSSLQTGILASYLITMTVGLLGNSLVIYVIARNAQIRNKSVANYYIWNLAFSDLFFVLTMPLFCYATYCNDWPFGTPMCKLSRVFHETNRYASMFTLVALSFDRYLASFFNMTHLRTVKAGVVVCCVIWVLCGTVSIPYWMFSSVENNQCITDFSSEFMMFWTYFQLAIALIIPLILICLSYILLAARLQMIMKASSAKSASVQKPSRKMIRTILVVVVIFLVCQVPWHAHEIISLNIHQKVKETMCLPPIPTLRVSMYLNTISTILGFVSSCCNPIIYGILNDNYRMQYKSVLCCCLKTTNPNARNHVSGGRRTATEATDVDTVMPRNRRRFGIKFPFTCCDNSASDGCPHRRKLQSCKAEDGGDNSACKTTEHTRLNEESKDM